MIFVFCCLERLPKYGNHIFWNFYMNHGTENVSIMIFIFVQIYSTMIKIYLLK